MAPGMWSQKSTSVSCCDRTRLLIRDPVDIQGTIKFTDNTTYWQANSFPFVFQNVTSFFKLGGEDVFIYGGEFQAGGCPSLPLHTTWFCKSVPRGKWTLPGTCSEAHKAFFGFYGRSHDAGRTACASETYVCPTLRDMAVEREGARQLYPSAPRAQAVR